MEYDFVIAPKLRDAKFFTTTALYRCLYGSRGSGKTRTIAEACLLWGMMFHSMGLYGQIVCAREYLNSLEDSSLAELKGVIEEKPELAAFWDVGANYIRSRDQNIYFSFIGLNQNLNSIKSRARILLVWVDEAETVKELAWAKLIPTVRYEDESWTAEIWVSFNPESAESATFKRFVADAETDPDFISVKMNWSDNPWFGDRMNRDRLRDKANRPDDYEWIWGGEFRSVSNAQIFKNWEVGEMEVPDNVVWFYGADWGFSNDETAGGRCCILGNVIYIDYEVYELGGEMETLPSLFNKIPGARDWPMRADSARPETIDYMRRHGFPKIRSARKGKGSVMDGISFIQGFKVVIHPRCPNAIREFKTYSYKTLKHDGDNGAAGDILPVPEDKNNHFCDQLRYSLESAHRKGKLLPNVVNNVNRLERPKDYNSEYSSDDDWKVA